MKKIIDVAEKIGSPSALTQDQGEIIYNLIVDAIDAEQLIELDFQNVESMISAFLNVAIGKLYGKYSEEIIKEKVRYVNFPKSKTSTLRLVISNAIKYYENNQDFSMVAKEVIG